jgi:hypothetical protein
MSRLPESVTGKVDSSWAVIPVVDPEEPGAVSGFSLAWTVSTRGGVYKLGIATTELRPVGRTRPCQNLIKNILLICPGFSELSGKSWLLWEKIRTGKGFWKLLPAWPECMPNCFRDCT